ncbi:hypothetical protein LTR08_007370 [Meristemomyces frigidus]|nr:hypothetical protein LTR08_007370 [Meristemomyces frigidus]
MGAPQMPAHFPCWCQATYSWGGETKKDLGFIEGDLIEALNAGDGSWWMGRLRRDPRAIGLFPSNFVKVLDESFQPAPMSRNPSPMIQATQRPATASPAKSKSVFRKPFDAYEKAGPRMSLDGKREATLDSDKEKPKKSKLKPYSSMRTALAPTSTLNKQGSASPLKPEPPRIPEPPPRRSHARRPSKAPSPPPDVRSGASASPTPTPSYAQPTSTSMYRGASPQPAFHAPSSHYAQAPAASYYRAASPQPGYHAPSPAVSRPPSRAHSPLPSIYHDGSSYPQILPASRQPSPNPYQQQQQQQQYISRAPSPAPSFGYQDQWRAPSPAPYSDDEFASSPPPPPPPAHRVAYQPNRAHSMSQPVETDPYARGGSRTPVPPSPSGDGGSHMTPSPLRDAMNDVMSSLHDMSVYQDDEHGLPSHPSPTKPASNIWSPDEFELVRSRSQLQHQRAQSTVGFATDNRYVQTREQKTPSLPSSREGPPELGNYGQRTDSQLRNVKFDDSYASERPPQPPLKGTQYQAYRPTTSTSHSSNESADRRMHSQQRHPNLKHRKSAYELGREALNRTYTTKTNVTNSTESSSATQSSTSTQLTSRSIMSGYSAGGFSATSAGSLARRKFGFGSQRNQRTQSVDDARSMGDLTSSARSNAASEVSAGSGLSYHESHASHKQPLPTPVADWTKDPMESAGVLGGLNAPKAKKSGFFKKMIESAKTGAASARSTIGNGSRPGSRAGSPTKSMLSGNGPTAIAGGMPARPGSAFGAGPAARDLGLGGTGNDWMQVRRDINRSNSLSRKERDERAERCDMLELPRLNPIDQLHEFAEGDEGLDGLPITEPTDFNTPNLALVDKSTRFIHSLPSLVTSSALAQSYICRPHRSDVQRLRAIFTWVSERITWEEDFEGRLDTRRVIQTKRGCSQEIAILVREMCSAVGLYAEEVHGYLKAPGEVLDLGTIARPNHWWNAVIVDGEWRIMDCALANPTNPRRGSYSCANSQVAESWYFLARPMEICYTHIPLLPEQQHIVPPVEHEVLMTLPCACPTYFRNEVELTEFDTSLLHLENLEMAHFQINVPEDVECVAETEARAFAQDADGDFFESGDPVTKKALAQAEWIGGRKRYTIKALFPGDDGQGVLKIYAGKRGLMHSIKDNPHPLALALPLTHTGQNPAYDFHVRHPTPHAQRHDIYVAQPQCAKLTINNTFVFSVRQHPSSLSRFTPDTWGTSSSGRPASPNPGTATNPYARPSSAMSMVSATMSQAGGGGSDYSSNYGQPMTAAQQKPAKLAIQTPSQKIMRLTRKQEHTSRAGGAEDDGLTTSWETVIKIGERGTWRGLVLADRSARWCVFAEWECL